MADKRVGLFSAETERAFAAAAIDGRVDETMRLARALPQGINTASPTGETALLFAVQNNDVAMVQALLAAGADPNGGPNRTPLHPSVRDPSGRLTTILLKAGADPNRTYNDETPLWEAALIDEPGNADLLIGAGAQLDKGNGNGISPAMAAGSAGHWVMAGKLIERGASPWHTAPNGYTLASLAASDRKLPSTPDGQARDAILERFRAMGYPWPPPKPPQVRALIAEGKWPPVLAPRQ